MDFVALFKADEAEDHQGEFIMAVAAAGLEEAVEKLQTRIEEIRKNRENGGMFDRLEKVYLDSIYQINEMPTNPMVLHYHSHSVNDASVSIGTDQVDGEQVVAYEWFPDDKEPPDPDSEESHEVYPFMEFR